VAKSFVSALVGLEVEDGSIAALTDPISDYIDVAPGSAYDGVPIRDVLQMSSGARWNEDYSDRTSDVFGISAALTGGTLAQFVGRMTPELEPGTVCRYNSGDTQALGLLVARATGRSLASYMQERLVEPLGMTAPSAWLSDGVSEAAFAGLNMTARDFARLGELYRNGGRVGEQQLLPAQWVRDSVTVTAPHLAPGRVMIGEQPLEMGYGYQWWIPTGSDGEFTAIGVYNQFVHVDPRREVTIVKLSANRRYGISDTEADNREDENLALLRALARQVEPLTS
jgi:CubicO group peptidase (beta-lactamase class C family)